jgi:flagellar protein FlgJ
MTLGPIAGLTPHRQEPDAEASSVAAQRKVAQQFEAIFLRKLLSGMEKSSGLGGSSTAGAGVFKSMMVGALADGAADGGGIGLAEVVLKSMLANSSAQPAHAASPATSTGVVPGADPNSSAHADSAKPSPIVEFAAPGAALLPLDHTFELVR